MKPNYSDTIKSLVLLILFCFLSITSTSTTFAQSESSISTSPIISKSESDSKFHQFLTQAGYEKKNLNSKQLLIVKTQSSKASLYLYEVNKNGNWILVMNKCNGYVGRKGISKSKKEGDDKTPLGLYNIQFAFGNKFINDTSFPYKKVTNKSYWVDDSSSRFYNQWIEGTKYKDWKSAEHLSEMPSSYAYALSIGYNTNPIVKGKGSAIFLHCGSKATSGCIATSSSNVIRIIEHLSKNKNPKILIY
ncbi:L,D-transpeptidase family protein [Anaeromicropila herbilytica]|uniref:L,D-TPase catalytic domain-containing protein n=1 Tax=Anaeromicropila herbilytica TaxID=2785025 RepID=A0A7R7EQA6_9FIRM|nr:L,D-transpeptidase family protein [Anaeromicropila herbilytica]BCN32982.1 hypothetical protein bsdtb5_42770 [Anaeromicropila herbilytica]